MKKRMWSLLLVIVMLIGILPVTASAAETTTTISGGSGMGAYSIALTVDRGSIADTQYESKYDAMSSTGEGTATITLSGVSDGDEVTVHATLSGNIATGAGKGSLDAESKTIKVGETGVFLIKNTSGPYVGKIPVTVNIALVAGEGGGGGEETPATLSFATDLSAEETKCIKNAAVKLEVLAAHSADGAVTYEWYCNDENSTEGGTVIEGAKGTSYTPSTAEYGTKYYYVVASAEGVEPVTSKIAKITVQEPYITFESQPQSKEYTKGDTAAALAVAATQSEGNAVEYQWYSNSANSTSGGTAIDGATGQTYTPNITEAGTTYYYAVATSYDKNGELKLTLASGIAKITVKLPVVSFSGTTGGSALYLLNTETVSPLAVSASQTPDRGAEISYQWYQNSTNSTSGGTAIDGATGESFMPPVNAAGTSYYYVVASAEDSTPATSKVYTVTVREMGVEFTANLSAATVEKIVGDSLTLSVAAKPTVPDAMADWESKLSYQWYCNTENSTTGGTAIEGATDASYTVPTAAAGTTCYYVVATLDGKYTATSSVATVTVSEKPTLPLDGNVIDIEDLTVYDKHGATAKVININIAGADVEKATQDNNTSVDIVLKGATAPDAEISVEFGHTGKYYKMSGHTGTVKLVDGKATLTMTLKGEDNLISSWYGTVTYTLNFSLGEPPDEVPVRTVESDSMDAYAGFDVLIDLSKYFSNATYYHLVDGDNLTDLDSKEYTFKSYIGGTHTLVFAASNNVGECPDRVTVTVDVSALENGLWIRHITSNGSLNYVVFSDEQGNAIEGMSIARDGNTITVTLPRSIQMGSKVMATFDITQNESKLPFISGSDSWQQNPGTTTQFVSTVSSVKTVKNVYFYNSDPNAISNNYTTYTLNYVIENKVPVLAEGQPATGEVSITADQSYTLDLDGIFVDPDADDTITGWKVSVNGADAVDAEVDENNVYSWQTDNTGVYTLNFFAVDSCGAVSTESFTVTVTVGNASNTYNVTVNVPDGVEPVFYYTADAAEGTSLTATSLGSVYTVKVPDNISVIAWRADGVGASTAVSSQQDSIILVKPTFVVKGGENIDGEAAVAVTHKTQTVVGSGNNYLLKSGDTYDYVVTPGASFAADYRNVELKDQVLSADEVVLNLVPKGLAFTVFDKAELIVRPAQKNQAGLAAQPEQPVSVTVDEIAGTKTYFYMLDDGVVYEYRAYLPEGVEGRDDYVTYFATFEKKATTAGITVTEEQLLDGSNGRTTINRNIKDNYGANIADISLNINERGYLPLAQEGDTYQIRPLRLWWMSNKIWATGAQTQKYRFAQPDFHYTVVDENGNASSSVITIDENGMITAVGSGTAIVLVTYDAMNVNFFDPDGTAASRTYDPNGFYSAIWPENTGVFVVSVGADDSGITTGMTMNAEANTELRDELNSVSGKNNSLNGINGKKAGAALDAELDVIYFIGEQGEYTFTPATDGVTVSVANPTLGNVLSFNGFDEITPNDDGSVTVPLEEGRNIVKLEKEGKAEYQVITAKAVSITVNGAPLTEDTSVAPGEKLSIEFDILYNPVHRISCYNGSAAVVYRSVNGTDRAAGNSRGEFGSYFFSDSEESQRISHYVKEGVGQGYCNSRVDWEEELVIPADYTGDTFTLTDGVFNVGGFGWFAYGGHRDNTWTAPQSSPNVTAYFGRLPDISLPVGTVTGISVATQPDKLTYNIGDVFDPTGMEVTANFKMASGDTKYTPVTGYTYDTAAFTEAGTKTVTISYGGMETAVSVTVTDVALDRLEVTAPPARTLYYAGDTFDPAGMVVTAVYSDESTREIGNYTCDPTTLSITDTKVTVTYGSKSVEVPISISLVESLKIATMPTKTTYKVNEYFDPAGMVVEAVYSDGSSFETTDYTFAPTGKLTKDNSTITITYSGDEGASGLQPVTFPITVSGGGSAGTNPDTPKPEKSITVYVSFASDGQIVEGVDGTLLYNAPVTITDDDSDGKFTMGDAFRAFHETYYRGGADGYSDDGNLISDFWGEGMSGLSYTLNHKWVQSISTKISEGARMAAFFHQDESGNYSDLYTYFDRDSYTVKANTENTFVVKGLNIMSSSAGNAADAYPEGATVTVYNSSGRELSSLSTTTDENGQFAIKFTANGSYIIEVSGTCSYTYSGGYGSGSVSDAPVVPSRCEVYVSGGKDSSGALGENTTVSVSGDENTINVGASVEGTKAVIDKADLSSLNTVIGDHVKTGTVTIDFSALDSEEPITTVEIPAAAIKQIAEAVNDPKNNAHSLEIVLPDGASIEFDAAALSKKASQAAGQDITISIESSDDVRISKVQKNAIGDRPAYDINVTSGGKHISDLGGKITIHVPYKLKYGEKAHGIVVLYVDENGNKERCETGYDPVKQLVNWKTDHLSLYMIDYDETLANNPFADITQDAYCYDAVLWAVDEGITNGTSDTTFSPNASCTRAQMVTFLWRAAGSPKAKTTTCVFTDVDKDAYYYEALLWAIENGITTGTSDTAFSPDADCNRGQMATFLYRSAKTPAVSGNHSFTDVSADAYYNKAVIWAAAEGITKGTTDTTFSPDADCTRGQMVTFLYRYLAE